VRSSATGSAGTVSATVRSSRNEAGSAQCTASTTSSSGSRRLAASSASTTAATAAGDPADRPCRRRRPRRGRLAPGRARSAATASRAASRPPRTNPGPTWNPAALARVAAASARVDLPMPASPSTSSDQPRPPCALASNVVSSARIGSRSSGSWMTSVDGCTATPNHTAGRSTRHVRMVSPRLHGAPDHGRAGRPCRPAMDSAPSTAGGASARTRSASVTTPAETSTIAARCR
jgi:hypothetical protein